MKILVISDVHSCIEALEAVWARESDADAIICAGDVVDWGWNPHEVICWLREHNAITVMGNHDLIVKNVYNSGNFQELGKEEEYRFHNANRLTEEDAAWLNALKETEIVTFGDTTYCIRHAYDVVESSSHVIDMIKSRSYIMGFEDMWREFVGKHECAEKRCIVLGHSHICYTLKAGRDSMYINPGSMSYRLSGNSCLHGADYIVINDGIPEMRHVDYSLRKVYQKIMSSGFRADVMRQALIYAGPEGDDWFE